MGRYFVRRILETIPLMLIISIFVFMFIHLLPGDPAKTLAGVEATVEEVVAFKKEQLSEIIQILLERGFTLEEIKELTK